MIRLKSLLNESINENSLELSKIVPSPEKLGTFENFLKLFVGKKLQTLLDVSSFSNLYVMNKYGFNKHDENDLKVLTNKLLNTTISYINYRKLEPIRAQLDAKDVEDRKTPEYQDFHKKNVGLLKQIFQAQRSGDKSLEADLRAEKSKLVDPSSYSTNFKQMDDIVKEFHNTPLSLIDVMPSSTDSANDKKRLAAARIAFDNYKKAAV